MDKKEFNKDFMLDRIADIEQRINQIDYLKNLTFEEFLKDDIKKDALKYRLLSLIEGLVSLCNHIISRSEVSPPSTYADCFRKLAELGISSNTLIEKMVKMIQFRNILINQYWTIEDEKIYEIAQIDHSFILEFIRDIKQLLEN
ncbi:MAG: type VII toxin-antitoxin system HepT family RNase toxin [Candidatus Heimdallarchaeaceae archaeon]